MFIQETTGNSDTNWIRIANMGHGLFSESSVPQLM